MARYRTYGALDDAQATDGDMAFIRWISRINPEQLQTGDVAYSQNGRMDNDRAWEPRKGVDVFSPALDIGSSLFLPFALGSSYDDSVINGVYGSAYFTDPVTDTDYLLIVTNNKVIAIDLDAPTTTYDVGFPGLTVYQPVEVLQALDRVFIFRGDEASWEWSGDLTGKTLSGAARSSDQVEFSTSTAHGFITGDYVTLSNVSTELDPTVADGTYEVVDVTSAITFTIASAGTDGDDVASGTAIKAFNPVASGAYAAVAVDTTPSNAVCVSGVVTVTETAHGRSDGDIVVVYDAGGSGLTEGDRYEITYIGINSYSFKAEIADGTYSITLGGKQPVGGGYIYMPNAEWGIYHQGRLILPYASTLDTGTSRDEIIFSDIFDYDTFDPILNQLRFGSGSADSLTGVAPLFNDRLLVLCRRSIHVVDGVSGALDDLVVTEITREVGCIARKSITEVGGTIMFLSDMGVYSITYGQELNLIANAIPLSEPIENYMRLINWEYAAGAIGAYADNRYFLAVPLGKSTVNNAVFVYNFLNQGWESLDTFPDGFDIANMIVAPYGGRNRVFFVNAQGAVHLTDVLNEADRIEISLNNKVQAGIAGRMVTRRYTMGNMDIKRYSRSTIIAESGHRTIPDELPDGYRPLDGTGDAGTLNIGYTTRDPDFTSEDAKALTIDAGEDYNAKMSIRKRGYGLQLLFSTSTAKVRGCTVDAILSSRNHVDRS